ncbi:hypothetical protein CgunFtcFv8_023040 [Champsocephalus gunnari]|uniref:ZP domain-containing protein n=1 Tax=Champsocephalus gunnari TaxID=52237 RepID=A0AAN8HL17_CHAGU|nr:hypothetical protein CgunFtcFv8_023040 [Champsocephalus gunnari]
MLRLGNILLWMAAANILGQARPNLKLYLQSSSGLRSDCAANVMRLSLDKALAVGNQLEVEAINGTKHILLTPSMAAQCGYSMESDPWGNTRIYTSLMGCFVDNKDDTVPETRVFNVLLGTFLHDVELRNITFSTGVLTVEESNAKGFTVQEHSLANGSKSFSLQVPFDADVVLKHNPERLVTSYFLPLIFGLIVLPEETPFALPVDLQASLQDVVLPIMAGTCDQNQFYISVKFGSHGSNFKAIVGPRELTAEMAEDYNFYENGTHLSLILPYTAKDAVFEMFTFTKDDEVLKDQIYVHCDAVICDTSSQADGSCRGQCVHPPGQSYSRPAGVKKERRSTDSTRQRQISSGEIILSNL